MKLYLVRHGQSIANASGGMTMPDPDLTALGLKQAEATASYFRGQYFFPSLYDGKGIAFSPQAIYSSPTLHGLRAAKVIAEGLGVPVVIVVGHGALFDHFAAVAFGHPEGIIWMSMHNAAIARIDLLRQVWRLVFWNQTGHMDGALSY